MMIGKPPTKSWYVRNTLPGTTEWLIHSRSFSGPWWLAVMASQPAPPESNVLPWSVDVHRSVSTASRSATYTVPSLSTSTSESPPPVVDAMFWSVHVAPWSCDTQMPTPLLPLVAASLSVDWKNGLSAEGIDWG